MSVQRGDRVLGWQSHQLDHADHTANITLIIKDTRTANITFIIKVQ